METSGWNREFMPHTGGTRVGIPTLRKYIGHEVKFKRIEVYTADRPLRARAVMDRKDTTEYANHLQ